MQHKFPKGDYQNPAAWKLGYCLIQAHITGAYIAK